MFFTTTSFHEIHQRQVQGIEHTGFTHPEIGHGDAVGGLAGPPRSNSRTSRHRQIRTFQPCRRKHPCSGSRTAIDVRPVTNSIVPVVPKRVLGRAAPTPLLMRPGAILAPWRSARTSRRVLRSSRASAFLEPYELATVCWCPGPGLSGPTDHVPTTRETRPAGASRSSKLRSSRRAPISPPSSVRGCTLPS